MQEGHTCQQLAVRLVRQHLPDTRRVCGRGVTEEVHQAAAVVADGPQVGLVAAEQKLHRAPVLPQDGEVQGEAALLVPGIPQGVLNPACHRRVALKPPTSFPSFAHAATSQHDCAARSLSTAAVPMPSCRGRRSALGDAHSMAQLGDLVQRAGQDTPRGDLDEESG